MAAPRRGDHREIYELVRNATGVDGATNATGALNVETHQLPTARQLQAVKAIGKRSRDNVRSLYQAIMERMSFPSSHVRVCCLELIETLFGRSSTFRRLACDRLDIFMARAVLGELPSPPAYANELRHRALACLRRWNREFGAVQPKLGLACRHLENLGMFAEMDDGEDGEGARDGAGGASGASGAGRGGPGDAGNVVSATVERAVEDFESSVAQWRILVKELENARVVLESSTRANTTTTTTTTTTTMTGAARSGGDDDDGGWEEVGEDEGLTEDVYVPLLESYREASSETIPKLQRIIAACRQMYTTGYNDRVSGVLRDAIALNAALVTACSAYERKLGDTVRKQHAERKISAERKQRTTQREAVEERTTAREERRPAVNPMTLIRDPTMPRERPKASGSTAKRASGSSARDGLSGLSAADERKRALLEKLAAVAPVVPAGGFAGVWDSSAQTTAMLGQTMEVANHWGPVDVTKELPEDRLDALFLIDQTKIKYGGDKDDNGHRDTNEVRRGEVAVAEGARPPPPLPPPLPASANLVDRSDERRYNEQVLRRATLASGFGFIDRGDGLGGTSDGDGDGTRRARAGHGNGKRRQKLTVKQSLTKKLKLDKT